MLKALKYNYHLNASETMWYMPVPASVLFDVLLFLLIAQVIPWPTVTNMVRTYTHGQNVVKTFGSGGHYQKM